MAQEKQAVSETGETIVALDEQRLKRDVKTYFNRIKTSKGDAAIQHNRNTFLQRKAALEKLGLSVIEQNGTIFTIDPRKN